MRKVFWENPYQRILNTKVAMVSGNQILFEDTIAFSFSGGQESDKTTINGLPVIDSKKEDNLIFYTLEEGHGLSVGNEVVMEIDWPRRHRLMRLHFAAELILELVTRKLGLEKIGAHIAENKARIDFAFDQNISFVFPDLLAEYNAIIERDELIETGYSYEEDQRRYWKIEGFAEVTCGGTHVKSTAEVGFITLKRVNIGGGKERIEISLLDDSRGRE
ncbi:MAG: alanyl-tRNA editing protein [Alphaproteobacteria bacterium]|nr:alanyl-tRNA editing protein [Alphaproteobacteria bacterium]